MTYREAKKLKIGDYAIPKHMGDKPPENLKIINIMYFPKRIIIRFENDIHRAHTEINPPQLYNNNKGKFDTTTGKWIPVKN